MKRSILVAENDQNLRKAISDKLITENFNVLKAENGEQAIKLYLKNKLNIQLILLEWSLPESDGMHVLRYIRKKSDIPVIFLTSQSNIDDTLIGLNDGADDYIVKPFNFEELLARIKVSIRHQNQSLNTDNGIIKFKNLMINLKTHEILKNGININLTNREFKLLITLIKAKGKALTRNQLLDTVWGENFEGQPNIVDVYIRLIRQKLEDNKTEHYIKTIRGVGYSIYED